MNRSSVAIALSGFLAACALLCALLGFFQPLFWPAAAASGATSYLLWTYGRRLILAVGYGAAGPGPDESPHDHGHVSAEDWHRTGFEYRTGDASSSDDDWDDWHWSGAFWRENDQQSSGSTGSTAPSDERVTDGSGAAGPGGTSGSAGPSGTGPWSDRWRDDESYRWWNGWDEERTDDTGDSNGTTGGTGAGAAGETAAGGGVGDGGRSSGTRQRQVSRGEEDAAAILGVDPDAPPDEVRAAYRERVLETHPDRGGDEAAFRRVCWAYDQLRD